MYQTCCCSLAGTRACFTCSNNPMNNQYDFKPYDDSSNYSYTYNSNMNLNDLSKILNKLDFLERRIDNLNSLEDRLVQIHERISMLEMQSRKNNKDCI